MLCVSRESVDSGRRQSGNDKDRKERRMSEYTRKERKKTRTGGGKIRI